mgnify:CR=1 FL=1
MIEIPLLGESLALLPERAAFWGRTRTLFVADFHLGKAASFRKARGAFTGSVRFSREDLLLRGPDVIE